MQHFCKLVVKVFTVQIYSYILVLLPHFSLFFLIISFYHTKKYEIANKIHFNIYISE